MTQQSLASSAGVFIDNRWTPAAEGRSIEVVAPADGQIYGRIAAGTAADVDAAVFAARRAFDHGAWGRTTALERGRILIAIGRAISDNSEELAQVEARDTGKPISLARADIAATARYFEFFGGAADKMHGETIPYLDGFLAMTLREPYGVTGHIIPWNYPAQMFGRSVAPSLAVGNAVIVKPAEQACQSVLRLAELTAEAGLPGGAIGIVPGYGHEAGAALAGHKAIDFITFTGSPRVGALVQTAAAGNHIGCTLELGGKSPHIIFADADLDLALPAVVGGIVQNAGQTCSAGSRVLIARDIYDEVSERLAHAFSRLRAGPPEMDCDLGPLISRGQQERVDGMCRQAISDGIKPIGMGSMVAEASPQGFYAAPMVFGAVPRDHLLAQEEIFGPALTLCPFHDEADAIGAANGTPYGLMTGVWTRDGSAALRVARKVKAGQIYINGFAAGGGIELPFGGFKKSGHGREKGFESLFEMSQLKTVVIRHG